MGAFTTASGGSSGAASIILLVFQGLELIGTLLPSTIAAAIALKKILEVDGSDFSAQIKILQDGAIQDATDTLAMIEAWQKANGEGQAG